MVPDFDLRSGRYMATQVTLTKSKLVPKDLGNPREAAAKPDGDNTPVLLGTLFGRASSVKQKRFQQKNPATGEVVEVVTDAIVGQFAGRRAKPLDNGDGTETVEIRSGVLYLPTGIAEMITVPLTAEDAPSMIEFAVKVSTRKANNPAGYEYVIEELYQPQGAKDPLDELRKLAVAGTRQIEHKPAGPHKAA